MKHCRRQPINDIRRCLMDAKRLAQRMSPFRRSDAELCDAFISLAGDEWTGFLAYLIWRSRSTGLST